jgi:radical SAM protein with 4Fe4S-binding SPASM domain
MPTPDHRFSPFKILRHDWRNARYPLHVQIDPVGVCNHDCPFCYFRAGARHDGQVRFDVQRQIDYFDGERLIAVLNELADLGVQAITLVGGGEPLLHPQIERILETIVARGLRFGIITNLSRLPNPDLLSRAEWIRVSADAASPETYAVMHGVRAAEFDHMKARVNRLAPVTTLGISFMVHERNWHELALAARLWKELGARYIECKPVYDVDRGEKIRPHLDRILELVTEAQRENDERFRVISMMHRVGDLSRPARNFTRCRVTNYSIQIGADGHVYPCCFLKYERPQSFGSLYEQSFREIWDGPRRAGLVGGLRADTCPPCWYDRTNEVLEYLSEEEPVNASFV